MSRRIRVLEVVRPSLGGMRKHVQGLIQGIDRDRFEVVLAAPEDQAFSQWAVLNDVRYAPVEISERTLAPIDVIGCLKLRRLIDTIRPDICHFHGFKAAAIGRVAVALYHVSASSESRWRYGVSTPVKKQTVNTLQVAPRAVWRVAPHVAPPVAPQVVYTVHNSVLSREDAYLSPASDSTAARCSTPHLTAFHSFMLEGRFPVLKDRYFPSAFQGKMCLHIERALARFTHRVIAVSKAIYNEYSAVPRLGQAKVRHIPNGIDIQRFSPAAPSGQMQRQNAKRAMDCAAESPTVGLVSRLIPHKGVKTFLVAIAELRRMGLTPQVIIAGDGPSRVELEGFTKELGLGDQVRFLGFIEDMVSFYLALDVFALSSFSEGMPLALIEAMAAGIPVVATRAGGTEEVATPGTGRLVAPGDSEAMAACIRDALLCPEESRLFADRARIYVKEKFSLEEMVRKTESVYEEVLACSGSKDLR